MGRQPQRIGGADPRAVRHCRSCSQALLQGKYAHAVMHLIAMHD